MSRQLNKLTDRQVRSLEYPNFYSDGGNLYLQVSKSGTKSFVFRYELRGKRRSMGLGPYPAVSLVQARESATRCRQLLQQNVDPLDYKNETEAAERLKAARKMTFDDCAKSYIECKRHEWTNSKHAQQWANTIKTYASPTIGALEVDKIGVADVLSVLEPIWLNKTETATRIRNRIELILDWAKVRGYRTGDNPAAWKGCLKDAGLPTKSKSKRVRHHPALPYCEIAKFIAGLREKNTISSLALEFCILTATRTSETLNATWSEFDIDSLIWVVPSNRMKAQKEHKIPLSARCIEILKLMERHAAKYVFPGMKKDKPLSNMSMLMTLRKMGYGDITVHGFRSTFRDWAAEETNHPNHVIEMALAHAIGNDVEAAYRRGDLFEKRRMLMQDWARFIEKAES